MNYCIVFFLAQPNIKQNIKMKPRGDSAKDLYMCCIQTLTLKPLTLKIYPPFSFFSLTVTVFTQCILFKKGMNGRRKRETKGWREEGKKRRGRKKSRGGEGREESRQAEV